jgi:hypothetical protein
MPATQTPTAADLVDNWRLLSYIFTPDDGAPFTPYGENPAGLITYTADGYMQVSIAASDRAAYGADDVQSGTVEQQAAARSYLTYAGRYEMRGDRVLYIVQISLMPGWSGVTLERIASLDGGQLLLTTPPITRRGRTGISRLRWERAGAE